MSELDYVARRDTSVKSKLSNSPFRYPGGKFYARRLIMDEIPIHDDYCEPFAGGASVFFAKRPVRHSILNDLDTDVINTFRQIRDRAEDLMALFKIVDLPKSDPTGMCQITEIEQSRV